MKPDWRLCTLTWLVVLLFGPAHTFAETTATAAERETARSAMDEGDRLRSAGEHQAALARYKAADDIMHVPTTGIEVAREQAELGLLVEARTAAIQTANLPVGTAEPNVFTEARVAATQLAAELEPRIPSLGTSVTPSGVEYSLSIDNIDLPSEARSLPFRTNPGEHEVVVRANGYVTAIVVVRLTEAEHQTLPIALQVAPQPAAVAASAAPASSVQADAADPGRAARIRGYVGLGVGGAVLAAGIATGIASAVQTSDLKKQCHDSVCPDSAADKLQSANTLANVANIGIPVGLLVLGYGVFELWTAASAPRPASASALHLQVNSHGVYAAWGGAL